MMIADPEDKSAMAQATEDFWARFGKALNLEVSTMKRAEDPKIDAAKWIQEDSVFGVSGGGHETQLSADDYATWPARRTHWHFKALVLAGRDAVHIYDLREMVLRQYEFLDITPANKKALITTTLYIISFKELFAVT